MISKVLTSTLNGIEPYLIETEVSMQRGLPAFNIVGLPDKIINESKDRIISAIKNSSIEFPVKHIIVNLAPAFIKKERTILDLPIAAGILISMNILKLNDTYSNYLFIGELSLDGSIRKVNGILPILMKAKKEKIENIILPYSNLEEGKIVNGLKLYPSKNLIEMIEKVNKNKYILSSSINDIITEELLDSNDTYEYDFSDVKGNEAAKRALEISAAGMHNILMVGAPGTGKTMLAKRLITILPSLSIEEAMETTKIYSAKGLLNNEKLITRRPFRSPHHTSSDISIVGGGKTPLPGEISLAHNGILFFDEFPEFKTNVIQALREPLEDGYVTISRATGTYKFPANFIFIAAMNPCPCGYLYSEKHECTCTVKQIKKYYNKISGPILDRIDIQIEIPEINFIKEKNQNAEKSADIKKRVIKAHQIQQERNKNNKNIYNAYLNNIEINKNVILDNNSKNLLIKAMEKLNLSPRAYFKILKIARTIADLENSEKVLTSHISEALQYRRLDRNSFSRLSHNTPIYYNNRYNI